MKKVLACLVAAGIFSLSIFAQTRFIVKFKDKGGNPFALNNPINFLSQRAIDRRIRYSISLDSTDLPVTPRYVDSVRLAGNVTILNVSKWLNSVTIQTTDTAALTKINSFPFVQSSAPIASRMASGNRKYNSDVQSIGTPGKKSNRVFDITSDFFNYGSSYSQIHIHNGEFLHDIGLRGQNMIIGMLDDGFNNYLTVDAFDSVRANSQILGIYDFVAHDNSVNEDDGHGEECFSTIASNMPGQFVGTAPKANFYLFRTEDNSSEYPIEEHNWVCGAEKIDSAGGDVISTSLGYTTFDAPVSAESHTYADMNGKTTMAAIGAGLAAKKGILVVIAAGNEGASGWRYITTPADADSTMAVGAVSTNGSVASWSSYGPTSDGRIKPDVVSVGVSTVIESPNNFVTTGDGTSFATPNMAGLTTCLWQGFQEFNNMKIIKALQQAGSNASSPDSHIGYGIPDVKKAVMNLLKDYATSNASVSNCQTTVSWSSKDVSTMKYEIERMLPGQTSFNKVGEQPGSGSIFSNHSYQYTDVLNGVSAGTIKYRIRQIIDTALATFTADYVDTATVTLTAACAATGVNTINPNNGDISIMPNPAKDQFVLKVTTTTASQNLVVRIVDERGRLISIERKTKPAGTASFTMSVSDLARGKYYVSVFNNDMLIATKELLKL